MRVAPSLALILLVACGQQQTGNTTATDNAAVTDVETLPPDESVATPTDQLVNGDDEAAASDNLTDIKGDEPKD